jgi:ribosomal protein L10
MKKKNNETKTQEKLEEKLVRWLFDGENMSDKEFKTLKKSLRKEGIEISRY